MINVLHIASHLGGGVGRVLSNVTAQAKKRNTRYEHEILLLEMPEQMQFVNIAKSGGVNVYINQKPREIEEKMALADIVQLEWWHHPKMAKFLAEFTNIPVRLVIWSHISGCYPPIIMPNFINMSSLFLFTSSSSKENQYLHNMDKDFLEMNTGVVYSSGGFQQFESIERNIHDGFNIGYVGTLNFSKLHPEYVDFCSYVDVPEAKFLLVGDMVTKDEIQRESRRRGIENKFEFIGYTTEVNKVISNFDVFGYPLNPEHYGTTENALLEAMASGIPPIVLHQGTEKYLVKNMETGLLVKSKEEYGAAIRYLYERPDERLKMGRNAKEYVLKEFPLDRTVDRLHEHYDNVIKEEKRRFSFKNIFGKSPVEWFMSCLGEDRKIFDESITLGMDPTLSRVKEIEREIKNCKIILREKTKSSIYHFHKYYPDDTYLAYWASILDKPERKEFS